MNNVTIEIPLPEVGQRFRLKHDVERFPDGIVPAGTEGTITESDAYHIEGLLDTTFEWLAEWGNCLIWSHAYPCNGWQVPPALDFHQDVEYI